jgi:predicted membrane protein
VAGILFFGVLFLPDFNIFWLILSPIIIAFYQVPAVYLFWLWKKKKNKID